MTLVPSDSLTHADRLSLGNNIPREKHKARPSHQRLASRLSRQQIRTNVR